MPGKAVGGLKGAAVRVGTVVARSGCPPGAVRGCWTVGSHPLSLNCRPGRVLGDRREMGLLPDRAKALPPPGIVNRNSVWLGLIGWTTAVLQNGLNRRPALKAGVHRQLLFVTVGWFLGYYLTKVENYKTAKLDQEMMEYIRQHPEKKTYAEILEDFHPIH
ncbi:NADH dehydrogenase [ubiquinone] 1 subunit C2 isoform X2 [Carcharodon carcharias]|uniref:NADH dehydrogenase [ubiquinone] 1 subunit C2 isoform X2 n=1 Tax=Carcharodon carcharias TaxID=13397 RepID=UPI001B7DB4FD|nr:NADH dehydrogenase [ubiquinone] 1 subunit C2 isoform X2 [Carcharodon carcharias]